MTLSLAIAGELLLTIILICGASNLRTKNLLKFFGFFKSENFYLNPHQTFTFTRLTPFK